MYNKKTYCPMPFISLSVNPGNYISRCMMSTANMGPIEKETYSNDEFKNLRQNMLDGSWDEIGCSTCFNKERQGQLSQRLKWLKNEKRYLDDDGIYKQNLNITRNKIYHLYMNFSNICNFKCRMCGPHYSNAWIPDYNKLVKNVEHEVPSVPPKQQIDVDNFLDEYGNELANLRQIWITGGEPFIDDTLFDFFEKLSAYTDLKNIKVVVNTNASRLYIEKLRKLKMLRSIAINISVDSTGELYTYMRGYNFTFEQLNEKINQLKKLQLEQDNIVIGINGAFQIYNILDIENFWLWGKEIANNKKGNWVEHRVLSWPLQLQARHATEKIKKMSEERIKYLIDQDPDYRHNHYLVEILKELEKPSDLSQIKKFYEWNSALDEIRSESFSNICPEIDQAWQEELNETMV